MGWRKRSWPGTPPGQQRDWEVKGIAILPLSTSSFVACICFAAQGFKIGSFVFTIGGRVLGSTSLDFHGKDSP